MEVTARLNEQNEIISTLRSENEVLKKQTGEWRQKFDAAVAVSNAARTQPAPASSGEQDRVVRQLSADNAALQKQVELWTQVARNTQSQPPASTAASSRVGWWSLFWILRRAHE